MFETVAFVHEDGVKVQHGLQLLAISTCGFCRKAKQFLKENGCAFDWVDVDLIDPEEKSKIASEFQKKFDARLMYPCLVVDGSDYLMSFIKVQWERMLEN